MQKKVIYVFGKITGTSDYAHRFSEEGKEYLLLLKNKRFVISELDHYSDGYFFDDFAWEDIEAWAELPEV